MPKLQTSQARDITRALQVSDTVTRVDTFKPETGGQDEFARTTAHEIILLGANSSGKTYNSLMKCAHHLLPEKDIYGRPTGFTIHPHRKLRVPHNGVEGWISTWSEKTQVSNIKPVYELILAPYEKNKKVEGGARHWAEFETGRIFFKWQTRGVEGYQGDKENFICLDEPHKRAIYNEAKPRLLARRGTMWMAATLVTDETIPELSLADVMWIQDELIDPWEASPDAFPLMDVIYIPLEENKEHIDLDFAVNLLASMSEAERNVRLTGRLIRNVGRCCFDRDILTALDKWLEDHPEVSECSYGNLEFDETDDDQFRVVFVPSLQETFPMKPRGRWIWKIWEHPIERRQLIRPTYYIGVDAAAGGGTDYTNVYVLKESGEMVAALHGHLSEIELARQLYLAGMYYCTQLFEPAMLAIEVVNVGRTAQQYLIDGHVDLGIGQYGIHRLFLRPTNESLDTGLPMMSRKPGWYTSRATRPYLITAMRQGILEAWYAIQRGQPCPIKDRGMLWEATSFVMDKTGKYANIPGVSNDDRLFSYAICKKLIEQYATRRKVVKVDDDDWYVGDDGNLYRNFQAKVQRARQPRPARRLHY